MLIFFKGSEYLLQAIDTRQIISLITNVIKLHKSNYNIRILAVIKTRFLCGKLYETQISNNIFYKY